MFILRQWYISYHFDKFVVNGDVYNNPKFCDGYSIHTSHIASIEVQDDSVVFVTNSGSTYLCAMKDICKSDGFNCNNFADNLNKAFEAFNVQCSHRYCLDMKNKHETELKLRLKDLLGNNELYVAGSPCGIDSAYFKRDNDIYSVPVDVHLGMTQDSILIMRHDMVDWRIFPMLDRLELYCWSEGLEAVLFENLANIEVTFAYGMGRDTIQLKPNDITRIPKIEYAVSGVF